MNAIMSLVASPLLHGAALQSVLVFFQTLVATETPGLGFKEVMDVRTVVVTPSLTGSVDAHGALCCYQWRHDRVKTSVLQRRQVHLAHCNLRCCQHQGAYCTLHVT